MCTFVIEVLTSIYPNPFLTRSTEISKTSELVLMNRKMETYQFQKHLPTEGKYFDDKTEGLLLGCSARTGTSPSGKRRGLWANSPS